MMILGMFRAHGWFPSPEKFSCPDEIMSYASAPEPALPDMPNVGCFNREGLDSRKCLAVMMTDDSILNALLSWMAS